MKSTICQSQSEGITRALGRNLATKLTSGGTIFLQGELGAGKTTFVQGVAEGLQVTDRVTSPTFTIMAVYDVHNHDYIKRLVHVDLYRITYMERVASLDLPELERDPATLLLVEWPERNMSLWQHVIGTINFSSADFNHRTLTVDGTIADLMQ